MAGLRVVKEGSISAEIASALAAQKGIPSGTAPLDENARVPAANSRVASVFGRTGDVGIEPGEAGEIRSIAGVSNPGGGIALVAGGGIVLSPDDAANSIGISENLGTGPGLSRVGNLFSIPVDGVVGSMVSPAIKDALPATQSLRSLGVGAQQAAAGDDARFHGRNHNLFSADHPDVDVADVRADGDALIWRATPGRYVHEAPGAAGVPDASSTQSGKTRLDRDPATATAPIAVGRNSFVLETFIEGLGLWWDSGTGLTVGSGAAWVPGLNRVLNVPSAISLTGLALTANTWYQVFLFEGAGAPAIEAVPAGTAAPYKGTARSKTGDPSRRFLFSTRSGAGGTLLRFEHHPETGFVRYLEAGIAAGVASPYRIISGGTATANTNVSCSTQVPPASTQMLGSVLTNASSAVFFGVPGVTGDASWTNLDARGVPVPIELDAAQTLRYRNAAAGGSTFLDAYGFWLPR